MPKILSPKSSGQADYARSLRSAARALGLGVITEDQFFDQMTSIVTGGLTRAFYQGAAECNIRPEELTAEEQLRRQQEINDRLVRIMPLADFILTVPRKSGVGLPASVSYRLDMWSNDYRLIKTIGAAMACGNKKKVWRLGAAKKHCPSCKGFNGRTYRYAVWYANRALPQDRSLCCNGYNCDCRLDDSTARVTPGPFPAGLLCN